MLQKISVSSKLYIYSFELSIHQRTLRRKY